MQTLADVGPQLDKALSSVTIFPYSQAFIDRAVRGDYMNIFATFDLTVPRLKRDLLLGTRWGQEDAPLVPAPGDPWYLNYTYDPLGLGPAGRPPAAPPPDGGASAPSLPGSPPSMAELPVSPPPTGGQPSTASPIFAGPYAAQTIPTTPGAGPPPVGSGG
jgi:hypothetical protein